VQKVVRVGFVDPQSASTSPRGLSAFWERLRELGYVDGQNLIVEARSAEGRSERLPALMNEVVGRDVDVLVTWSTSAAIAAKNATSTIPIVAAVMGDPVGSGLAVSLARPGGNLTGLSVGLAQGLASKWVELLKDMVPRLSTLAVIANPTTAIDRDLAKELQVIAPAQGLKLRLIEVREPAALDRAFEQAGKAQAVLVLPDPMLFSHRRQVTALAARHRLPAIYPSRDYIDAGGLITYGPDFAVMFRRAADYVDKILRGARPGDLPIEQPTQHVLVVNLKTAKTLGITMPESILLRANEVIR
jgi:putative ABC transport system substrate-binding protein